MLMFGAYVKYSSTAFVTFKSRISESIAQQMLLSMDALEINHAPNPKDIIWDNVSIPKSQVSSAPNQSNHTLLISNRLFSPYSSSLSLPLDCDA
jgi:hypothetical protein